MDQLIERVLAVGARFAPIDLTGVRVRRACRRVARVCRCSPS